MRKTFERPSIIYFTFLLSVSIFSIALIFFDYTFMACNEIIWFIFNVIIEVAFMAWFIVKKENSAKIANIISQLLPLLSFIYICTIILINKSVSAFYLATHGIICFISCFVISLLYRNKRIIKIIFAILNTLLLLFLLNASFLIIVFEDFGQNTIVKQIASPNQVYTAILINSNQGALGGDTIVDVEHNTSEINIGLGRLKRIERVYVGNWGEFETMDLKWRNDNILLINGASYSID